MSASRSASTELQVYQLAYVGPATARARCDEPSPKHGNAGVLHETPGGRSLAERHVPARTADPGTLEVALSRRPGKGTLLGVARPHPVVPANAGTQRLFYLRRKGRANQQRRWVPAFAGTTRLKTPDSDLSAAAPRRHDGERIRTSPAQHCAFEPSPTARPGVPRPHARVSQRAPRQAAWRWRAAPGGRRTPHVQPTHRTSQPLKARPPTALSGQRRPARTAANLSARIGTHPA
ncbi:hypothetical protein HNQ52_003287 [Chiayiivirga flava]|uniref:Uncharacterized protein n=1 Tax=Chiayiivirga flava TaxID=659595 RepID=A0A7W8DAD4_9GAMM|nr:hypothetical protein [Chiayiivirga flava]